MTFNNDRRMLYDPMTQPTSNVIDSSWKPLYRIGGVAALLAVFVFRRFLGAELMAFRGFGILPVPETMPASAADWFALLATHKLVGLALLDAFDLIEYVLVGLLFLAVCAALWQAKRAMMLIATICGLLGIFLAFASNQAFAMLSLNEHYAAATTEAGRAVFLAAGESLLAEHNPGVLHQGTGAYASLFFVYLSGLMISIVMIQTSVFSKSTAVTGILANSFGLAYFPVVAFAPGLLILPFTISAPFRVVWYFLIARKLFQIGKMK